MKITAHLFNRENHHEAIVATGGTAQTVAIAPKSSGFGSSVNGGELLLLALATCYCNDLYREASKRGMELTSVEVEAEGDFGPEGLLTEGVTYSATVEANASEADVLELMRHTDAIAEIHGALRQPSRVTLTEHRARAAGS